MRKGSAKAYSRLTSGLFWLFAIPFAVSAQPAASGAPIQTAPAPKGPLKLSLDADSPPVEPTPDAPGTRPPRRLNTVIVHGKRDHLFDSDLRLARLISRLPSIGTDSAPTEDDYDEVMDYITTPGDPNDLPDEQQTLLQQQTQPMHGGQPGAIGP